MTLNSLVRQSDVVHLNLAFPSGKYQLAAAVAARAAGKPLVVTHHLAIRVPARWSLYMRWLGRRAVRSIAISEAARQFLIREFDYPPARVVTIHNGIDPVFFSAPERRSPDSAVCCTVARLSPQKGLMDLLEATAIVIKKIPRARLLIIGDGELRDDLVERTRVLGLQEHVRFLGALPPAEVARQLAGADLFLLPSLYEGGPPLALMEAMASGLPAVATDVLGVRELVAGSETGTVVPVGDPAQLAAAAIELLADPARRAAAGSSARAIVLREFTLELSMRKTEQQLDAASVKHG